MTQRDRIVLAVLGVAVLLAGFWMVGMKPKREELAKFDKDIAAEQQKRDEAQSRIAAGEQARKRFAEDYATVARLGKAVPVNDQIPSLLYQLERTADRHSVDFRTMKLTASGAPAASAPAPAPSSGSGSGSSSSSSSSSSGSSSSGATAPATQAAAAVAPPGSAIGAAGFPTMPFAFKFDADFLKLERFLSSVEQYTSTVASGEDVDVNGRLLTIDGISLSTSAKGYPRVKAAVAATAYLLPPDQGLTGGATAAGPAAAGSGTTAKAPAAGGTKTPAPATAVVGGPIK